MTVRLSRINSELNYDGRGVGMVPGGDLHDSPGGARVEPGEAIRHPSALMGLADIDWPRCCATPGLSGEPLWLHIAYVR